MNKKSKEYTDKAISTFYEKSWLPQAEMTHCDKTMSLHFGHFEKGIRSHEGALINKNKFIGNALNLDDIKTNNCKFLDSGCGVGGTSIFFAKQYPHIKFFGITNSIGQIFLAKKFAEENDVSSNTGFIVGDFLSISFKNNIFDGLFAIQSFNRSNDKRKFLEEANRVLKENAKLVIDDAFLLKKPKGFLIKKAYDAYCKSWEVSNLLDVGSFKALMDETGFYDVKIDDITKNFRYSFYIINLKSIAFSLFYRKKKTHGVKNKPVNSIKSSSRAGFINVLTKFVSPIILSLSCKLRWMSVTAVKKEKK